MKIVCDFWECGRLIAVTARPSCEGHLVLIFLTQFTSRPICCRAMVMFLGGGIHQETLDNCLDRFS
jgi:hypothetical protein